MSRAKGIAAWLRTVLRPGAADARMDEEFAFHLDLERRKLARAGLPPEEARRQALVAFGGVQRHRMEMREGTGVRTLVDLSADIPRALRRLRRRPAFALAVALTLAIGLAALGAAYSVAYGVLLRPLPFPDGDRLVMVWQTRSGWQRFPASYPIYDAWSRQTGSFAGLAAYGTSEAIVTGGADPERVSASPATASLADVLGVSPARGRWFTEREDLRGDPVVVVSHDYWRTRLGADPDVIGRNLLLDDQPRTIIGVMPTDVRFPSERTAVWVPLGPDARSGGWNSQSLAVIGRLAPGRTVESAAADVAAVTERAVASGESPEVGSRVVRRSDDVVGNVRGTLLLSLAAAVAVLLIGFLNVTNLFLARGVAARRELATLRALGAGRIRLAWQLVAEGLVLGLAGAVAGLVLARVTLGSIAALLPARIPRISEVSLDTPVLLAVIGAAVIAGALLGIVASVAARSEDGFTSGVGTGARHTTGVGARRVRSLLVGAQVAGVFALVSGAGLLLQSLDRLLATDRGFDERRLVALVEPQPLEARYPNAESRDVLFRMVSDRLASIPGIEAVALVAPMPFGGSERTTSVSRAEQPDPLTVGVTEMTAGGFDVLGVRVIRGRGFVRADEGAAGVAVIGESVARWIRPDGDVLGTSIALGASGSPLRIVGVAGDVRQEGLDEPPLPRVWIPYSRQPGDDLSVIATVAGDPAATLSDVRNALIDVDPTLAAERVETVAGLVGETAAFPRFRALVMLILAIAGGAIAAVGIYGVTSCAVAERRRELSIRNALGAGAARLVGDALGLELRVVVLGLIAGLPAALLMGRVLGRFLHEVAPADPAVHGLTAVAIVALTAAAVVYPAVSAVRSAPMAVLREE